MQPRFVDEIVGFHPEIHHYSLWGAFDLAPSRLGLMCTTLFWQHLLCFAAYRYKFWFWEFKHALPEEDGGILQQSKGRAPRWEFPRFSENWGRRGWIGGRERVECLSSWSSSQLLNSCAAGQAWVQKCVKKSICLCCSSHVKHKENVWYWKECGLVIQQTIGSLFLYIFFQLACIDSCSHTNK